MKSLRAVGLWRSSVVVRAFRLLASDIARHAKCFRGWDVRSTKYTVPCQWWAVVLGVVLVLAVEARAIAETSTLVFETGFEREDALRGVEGPAKLEQGYQGEKALSIENPPEQIQASRIVSIVLPVDVVRGRLVRVTAMVKAEGVTAKPKPWNGIKCMLVMEASDRKLWPQAEIPTGTFDWQRAAFTARVPANVTSVRLVLGLEAVAGKVWFDNIKVVAVRTPIDPKEAKVPSRFYKGHTLPRLRGAMVSPDIDEEGLRVLGREWNANLVRWQLVRHGRQGQSISLAEYNVWLEQALNKLDKSLPWCEEHGLYVVVDLHSPPGGKVTAGGYAGSDDRLFSDKACQARFVEIWRHIAQRYKHCKAIWGYDLANEPVEDFVEEGCDDWQALAERAAREIRNIDPDRAIIVEPASWGGPDGLRDLVPLPMSNVVYSVHMYVPHAFTHQGVYDRGPAVHYPGVIGGEYWDKSALERVLRPVIEFQQTYGVHIYIGEFSAIRWAPGDSAMQYLRDLIEIFEKHGWDWSYHAFREWHGWSVEHDSDRNNTRPVETPTDRQMLLRQWYSQNQKPPWWRK